jgi:hypothetical protein
VNVGTGTGRTRAGHRCRGDLLGRSSKSFYNARHSRKIDAGATVSSGLLPLVQVRAQREGADASLTANRQVCQCLVSLQTGNLAIWLGGRRRFQGCGLAHHGSLLWRLSPNCLRTTVNHHPLPLGSLDSM